MSSFTGKHPYSSPCGPLLSLQQAVQQPQITSALKPWQSARNSPIDDIPLSHMKLTSPVMLLLARRMVSRFVRPDQLRGTSPSNLFLSNLNTCKLVEFPMDAGNRPPSRFRPRFNSLSSLKSPHDAVSPSPPSGRDPLSLFLCKSSTTKFLIKPTWTGNVPLNLFLPRRNPCKFDAAAKPSGGSAPESRLSDRPSLSKEGRAVKRTGESEPVKKFLSM
mmetsp:Transcript_44385/g.135286  ORF Transcript_44385/g.135286 Transcript_44385/m.135286 type:complete len:218 (-) Transcript_44385:1586-2239(-)